MSALRCPTMSPRTLDAERVEFWTSSSCSRLPEAITLRRDVARAADDRVVGRHHAVEELPVDVVEAGPALADTKPSLTNAPARIAASHVASGGAPISSARRPLQHDAVPGPDLLEQLPQQGRHPGDADQAEHRVVGGAGQLVALAGAQPQRRVVAGVEELAGADRVAVAVDDLEVDVVSLFGASVRRLRQRCDRARRRSGPACRRSRSTAWRRPGRCRGSRSCPGRRPAGSACDQGWAIRTRVS